jgi:cytochrome c-type biogenesis protein CcmH
VRRLVVRGLLVAALAALALPGLAAALSVDDVASEVRCPTCNAPLNVSSSPLADRMRDFIDVRIKRGWSKDRIIDALVVQFGPDVRTTPPKSGFGLVAWLVPLLAVAAGLAAIPILTRMWSRRRQGPAPATPPSGPDAARLQEELDRYGPP